MPTKETPVNPPRIHIAPLLANLFVADYNAVVEQYAPAQQLEITEHLLAIVELFRKEAMEPAILWQQYHQKEDALLIRYGKMLRPYATKQFHQYFDYTTVLIVKGIYSSEIYNGLTPEEQGLTVTEIAQFLHMCNNTLYHARYFLYLEREPQITVQPVKGTPATEEPDNEITKARQLLAIFYLLKTGFAIEHRDTHSVSAVAQLVHLLTGTKFTTTQNSDIYKKYASMPNYNKGEQLITDLQFIQPYFNRLNMQEAVQLIEEEINRAIKDLPAGARNKYRNKEI